MRSRDLTSWVLWKDALFMLEHAERLQRQFFHAGTTPSHTWEPPIDILETPQAITIHLALPGIAPTNIVIQGHPTGITVSGIRRLPIAENTKIHRVEIPYGRFERHIMLPLAALEPVTTEMSEGCLILTLKKRKETS